MLGAIAGDIIGSIYERRPIKSKDFPLFGRGCRFTDDSVCTVAVADCLVQGGDFAEFLRTYVHRYPGAGYGGMFLRWALTVGHPPYGSWGNGAAMRVGAVAHLAEDEGAVLDLAERSSMVSHDHPEAVKGAQATALAAWLARHGAEPGDIRREIAARFGYDLSRSVEEIRPGYGFDVSAAGTVPQALVCALEADNFEDAVRNAVSLGGDADTLAAIAGGIAEALFGLPDEIAGEATTYLDAELREVVTAVYERASQTGQDIASCHD